MTDFDASSEKIQFNQTTSNELDNADQLANFRSKFVIEDPNLIYLDGNSLGRLPKNIFRKFGQFPPKVPRTKTKITLET